MSSRSEESLAVLSRALDQTAEVLAAIPTEKLHNPTTCSDWDVTRLTAHVVAGPSNFVVMAEGNEPDWSVEPDLPDDWTAEFRTGADKLLTTWRDAGSDASPEGMDWQTAEFAVHAWELAKATGQSRELDEEVAQRGYSFMHAALTPENRGDAFAPEVAVADDATAYERLVAFAGRKPSS
ncbi:TIGR03086 family metal-binding protein [Arthrobacter tecti]